MDSLIKIYFLRTFRHLIVDFQRIFQGHSGFLTMDFFKNSFQGHYRRLKNSWRLWVFFSNKKIISILKNIFQGHSEQKLHIF